MSRLPHVPRHDSGTCQVCLHKSALPISKGLLAPFRFSQRPLHVPSKPLSVPPLEAATHIVQPTLPLRFSLNPFKMSNADSYRISSRGSVTKPSPSIVPRSTSRPRTHLNDNRDEIGDAIRRLQDANKKLHDTIEEQWKLLAASRSNPPAPRPPATQQSSSRPAGSTGKIPKKQQSSNPSRPKKPIEKRLRRHRSSPPASFDIKLFRARTQRMIVLDRRRSQGYGGAPTEEIDIVGSTGNVYTVTIGHVASCTCPDSRKGNECKHKVYALHTVLKAPRDLVYQLAFLTPELKVIFDKAPPIPTRLPVADDDDSKGNRKPTDGECPICYMDLAPSANALVWCQTQCGHNLHKSCFDQWAASQRGQQVKCVYCRTPWHNDVGDLDAIKETAEMGEEGYLNVAQHFGMSSARRYEYVGYHQPWSRRTFGVGW